MTRVSISVNPIKTNTCNEQIRLQQKTQWQVQKQESRDSRPAAAATCNCPRRPPPAARMHKGRYWLPPHSTILEGVENPKSCPTNTQNGKGLPHMRSQKTQKNWPGAIKLESTSQMRSQKRQTKRAWCAKNGEALPRCVPKRGKRRARVFDRSFPFRAFIEGPF